LTFCLLTCAQWPPIISLILCCCGTLMLSCSRMLLIPVGQWCFPLLHWHWKRVDRDAYHIQGELIQYLSKLLSASCSVYKLPFFFSASRVSHLSSPWTYHLCSSVLPCSAL
jgi:hypothetical protein